MKNDYRPRFLDGYLERHFYRRQPEGILKAQNQSICDLTGIESYSELSYVDLRSNRLPTLAHCQDCKASRHSFSMTTVFIRWKAFMTFPV